VRRNKLVLVENAPVRSKIELSGSQGNAGETRGALLPIPEGVLLAVSLSIRRWCAWHHRSHFDHLSSAAD
jgi:hypothetical protein